MSNLSEREVLYHLLQIVLIDIRAEAYKAENSRIFQLSNLFHNLPLQFIKRDRGELTNSEIFAWFMKEAQRTGLDEWVTNTVKVNIP